MRTIIVLSGLCAVSLLYSQASAPEEDAAKLRKGLEQAQKTLQDWPNLHRYASENASVREPGKDENRVVFMGDSITDAWNKKEGRFFALQPKVVVILAGTNDLAGNTGPISVQATEDNLQSMAELAKANGIRVVLSSIMPVCDYIRPQTERRPPAKIIAINEWMKSYAAKNGFVYLDYYTPMLDDKNMLKQEITGDGLHPNDAGYVIMAPLAERAIAQALRSKN
jgi:lysophospholipase L1-like esterase